MKFYTNTSNQLEISLVIPGVHPGPFKPIGGSNLPYELLRIFSTRALVVHNASDHSFNIPSKKELTNYLNSFSTPFVFDMGSICTEPIQIQEGDFIVTAIAFGRVCLIILLLDHKGWRISLLKLLQIFKITQANWDFQKSLLSTVITQWEDRCQQMISMT